MIISLIESNKLFNFNLPIKISGSFPLSNYNNEGEENRIAIIYAENNQWLLKGNDKYELISPTGQPLISQVLELYKMFIIRKKNTSNLIFIFANAVDETMTKIVINNDIDINIGSDKNSDIIYNELFIETNQAILSYKNSKWHIKDTNSRFGIYLNNKRVKDTDIKYGSEIFIMGLKIILLDHLLSINLISNKVTISGNLKNNSLSVNKYDFSDAESICDTDSIDNKYFSRSPRFKSAITEETVKVDSPPTRERIEATPLALVIGPAITMAMTSLTMASFSVLNAMSSGNGIKSAIPSIAMALSMLLGSALWPTLSRKHEKKRKITQEQLRQKKYLEYLKTKDEEIFIIMSRQSKTLYDTNQNIEECLTAIIKQNRNLWEREVEQSDFLTIRLGLGNIKRKIKVDYSEEGFTLEDDNLKKKLSSMCNQNTDLINVPVTISLIERNILGIIGSTDLTKLFSESVLVQLLSLHSYYDLKLVFFIDQDLLDNWQFLKYLSHCWNDDFSLRFIATNIDDTKILSSYLEQIFISRKDNKSNIEKECKYLLFTNWKNVANKAPIFDLIFKADDYLGFSIISVCNYINDLPTRCNAIINANTSESEIFTKSEYLESRTPFKIEYNTYKNYNDVMFNLANIKINAMDRNYVLPKSISFLEMYDVSKVEQLNIANRWIENNPTNSLQVPVGVDVNGNLFKIDLHEKYHGPHGLIAGMTGSGKSEFIITLILSLSVNYSPEEVSFVLIDYKGGGLTGAFENKDTNYRLPHLAGTITNLDGAEVKRALVSIQSELKRRQALFNDARDELGEGTIDIYKYQKYYREGKIKTAVSHLFIISDEFAELKTQQPDFLDQLISTARIGRSLGVHLILATQKPSGVVNDQIWSNSRFRVCLKVQDKSDSQDMIKTPDAADIKDTGRFYLQVGYNEYYALGQSAWCGESYIPSDTPILKVDSSLDIIDNIGQLKIQVDNDKKKTKVNSQGQQLTNIVKLIATVAKEKNVTSRLLWLDKISDTIYLNDLEQKYNYQVSPFILEPIIGEYDIPASQTQKILTLPLSSQGNCVLYGSSGSGIELFLSTIIYSIISHHSPEEINIYMIDFGTEQLRMFEGSPYFGGIAYVNDFEKINNLLKMVKDEIELRKKLFVEFSGNYHDYIKHSGKSLPNIMIIINNFDTFLDTYNDFEQTILQLTRECITYGIYFVISASSSNGVRYRISQNFKINYLLQLNNQDDYYNILGRVNGLIPSNYVGRGIFKIDNAVYEFQTAKIVNDNQEYDYIKKFISSVSNKYKVSAKKIPILPEKVTYEYVKDSYKGLHIFPVGAEKQSLNIACYNFYARYINPIYAATISEYTGFANTIISMLEYIRNMQIIILDNEKIIDKSKIVKASYVDSSFSKYIKAITDEIKVRKELYVNSNYDVNSLNSKPFILLVITGLGELFNIIDADTKTSLCSILADGKNIFKINVIIFDNVLSIKKQEYEPWYRENVVSNYGIWLGDGIADQSSIKVTRITSNEYKEIGKDYGYIVINGKLTLIKLLESETEYNQNE